MRVSHREQRGIGSFWMSTISVYLHFGQMTSTASGLVPSFAVIIGPDRWQRGEVRIGEKYLLVYNIKVEDVKHSLCASISTPAGGRAGEKADRIRRFSGR